MKCHKVVFQPGNLALEAAEGSTVMEIMNGSGIDFDFPCGGAGKCGKCRVKILQGAGRPTARELQMLGENELNDGIRLACLTGVRGDMSVELPGHKRPEHNILIAAEEKLYRIEPHPVPGAGQQDNAAPAPALGMAFDIGTTTIVGYLLDLHTGKELSVVSALNPQTKFGADVVSRINFAVRETDGLNKLHVAVTEAIDKLIGEAAEKSGFGRSHIYGLSVAANTCMHHLFLGINPRSLGVSPYLPAVSGPVVTSAAELRIDINPAGRIYVLPNIAGFVGADMTAVLLATELDRSRDVRLVIDIGTNGEIALGSEEKIAVCSAAAGPAFEGAQISSGMRGAAGAIDHVYFRDRIEYTVIGGGRPLGICGSALLDAVAGLVEAGIIDKRGRLLPPEKLPEFAKQAYGDNLVRHRGQPSFLLADAGKTGHGRPIVVTQHDIRQLQLAKGAMAAGVRALMVTLDIRAGDIKEVLLAGAFGNYLDPHSACVIGLVPPELENRIKMIGNAAGAGAKLALLSSGEYRRAAEIAEAVKFVELGSYPGFNSIFAEAMYFSEK